MIEPKVIECNEQLRTIVCECEVCHKVLFTDSCGQFRRNERGEWVGICYDCVWQEEYRP